MKKRSYVTFFNNNEKYINLSNVMIKSIKTFSVYPIEVYNEKNFNINIDESNFSKMMIYKILSIKKALDKYDEVIWLDIDIVVNEKIDMLWDNFKRINKYPLLANNRFDNFIDPPYDINNIVNNYENFNNFKNKIGLTKNIINWRQACVIASNKSCYNFLNEINDHLLMDNIVSDEDIFNFLYLKYNFNDSLGDIFICSEYFVGILNDMVFFNEKDYLRFFNEKILLKTNNYNNICLYHGQKDDKISEMLFLNIMNNYKKLN